MFNQAFTDEGPAAGVGSISPSSMIDVVSRHAEEGSRMNESSPPCLVARAAAQGNGMLYVQSQSGSLLAHLALTGSDFSLQCSSNASAVQNVFTSMSMDGSTQRSDAASSSMKIAPLAAAPALACQLRTGREARLAKVAQKIQKRRASMLPSFSTAPTNLSEVYVKTRAAASAGDMQEGDADDYSEGDSSTYHAAHDAASAMREAKEAMQKRGEMLSLLAAKGEAFQNDTDDFRAAATAKRKQLEAKFRRWGF